MMRGAQSNSETLDAFRAIVSVFFAGQLLGRPRELQPLTLTSARLQNLLVPVCPETNEHLLLPT
jgi:hypothetical protein